MLKITQKIKPLVLCILDGWGLSPDSPANAITKAQPKNFNSLWFSYPHTHLVTSGSEVGLPTGQVGNSEVGHQNLGAGRIVYQNLLRINLSIENGDFFKNSAFTNAVNHVKTNNSNVHLLGLVGSGNVHSSLGHLLALLDLFKGAQVPSSKVKLHLFTDGRDSPPTSAKTDLVQIAKKTQAEGFGQIATLCGRYFAMDRDNRWDRTKEAYFCLTGRANLRAFDPLKVIEESYAQGITDEFIKPVMMVDDKNQPLGPIGKGDALIFFNFRPDRARQLTKAFVLDDFSTVKTSSGQTVKTFDRGPKLPDLFFVSMTQYQAGLPVSAVAFPAHEVVMPIAHVFAQRNQRQLHIAETEKYAHVTYFFNGVRETPFSGEDRLLVNSPKVSSYDLKPEMSTPQVTQQLINRINSRIYDFIVVNLANADMVGHTGNFEATVKAIQSLDTHLGLIVKTAIACGGGVVITADHGNAEQMTNPQTGEPDTQHQKNPAPCIFVFSELRGRNIQLARGLLADVATSILGALNIPKPSQMTGRNLLEL